MVVAGGCVSVSGGGGGAVSVVGGAVLVFGGGGLKDVDVVEVVAVVEVVDAVAVVVVFGACAIVNVPASVPGGSVDVAVATCGSVKLVVVSVLVSVIAGGGTSPGTVMVELAAVEVPSWTTSYCCCSRCRLSPEPLPHAARSVTAVR